MTKMDMAAFKKLVELHSADLSRWPQALIHPAIDFMHQDAAARDYFTGMEEIESVLRHDPSPEYSPDAAERLQASIMSAIRQDGSIQKKPRGKGNKPAADTGFLQRWFDTYLAPAASGLIAACFLGIIVGLVPAAQAGVESDPFTANAVTVLSADAADIEGDIF